MVCDSNVSASKPKEKNVNSIRLIRDSNILKQKSDTIQWLTPNQFTPISFIHTAAKKSVQSNSINVITMVDDFPQNWVKDKDVDSLLAYIESTEKCNCFLNPLSSYIPVNNHADVGGYAIIFINSFRYKQKVDLGLYSCPKTDSKSVDEIRKWWADYKQNK